jgi:dTDP-4-amino-4,6-dideoxygalactose transaminase
MLDEWTDRTRRHAAVMNRALEGLPGIAVPHVPSKRTHVYYQYCVYGPDGPKRDDLVVRCVRRGIDIETLHVDVPPDMELFADSRVEPPERRGRAAAGAMQIPVSSTLTDAQIDGSLAPVIKGVLARLLRD